MEVQYRPPNSKLRSLDHIGNGAEPEHTRLKIFFELANFVCLVFLAVPGAAAFAGDVRAPGPTTHPSGTDATTANHSDGLQRWWHQWYGRLCPLVFDLRRRRCVAALSRSAAGSRVLTSVHTTSENGTAESPGLT